MELYLRIEADHSVQSLWRRRNSASGDVSGPEWIKSLPWQFGQDEGA
jgi:hypothetical protein